MSTKMGVYCKAYYLKDFRQFHNWDENSTNARPNENSDTPRIFDPDSILYLQDDLVVTDGIFKNEHVVFDNVNEEWTDFCNNTLEFAIPDDVLAAQTAVEEALEEQQA